jgi:hypothetical protein
MKFLCVPCDRPMTLDETRGPERGSMTLVYGCPACGYEIAMLTNAHETQVVGSLGVRVAPAAREGGTSRSGSACPFTGIVRALESEGEEGATREAAAATPSGVEWSDDARERLARLPDLVRSFVQEGIERFARERGLGRIDGRVLDEARTQFER